MRSRPDEKNYPIGLYVTDGHERAAKTRGFSRRLPL
jgi:hypothetical protein